MSTAASPAAVPVTPSSVRRHQSQSSYADRDRDRGHQTTPTKGGAPSSPRRSVSQSHAAPSHSRSSSGAAQGQLSNVARRDFEQTNVAHPASSSQRNDSRDASQFPARSDSTRQTPSRQPDHTRYNSQDMPPAAPVSTNGSAAQEANRQNSAGNVRRRTTIDATTGDWELGKTIGAGSMGKVKLAKNKETGEQVRQHSIPTPRQYLVSQPTQLT